jgi:hypothetical protein
MGAETLQETVAALLKRNLYDERYKSCRENALPVVVCMVVRFSQAPPQGAGSARHAIVHNGVHTG